MFPLIFFRKCACRLASLKRSAWSHRVSVTSVLDIMISHSQDDIATSF